VNLKRVARLMRGAGGSGSLPAPTRWLHRPRPHRGTQRRPGQVPVHRRGVHSVWVTDITEHPTKEGTVYCAAVMDAYSRLIVGWSIAEHMRHRTRHRRARPRPSSVANPRNGPTANEPYSFRSRPRNNVLGVRTTPAHRQATRLHGHRPATTTAP
jgi:transposase InsO family protein